MLIRKKKSYNILKNRRHSHNKLKLLNYYKCINCGLLLYINNKYCKNCFVFLKKQEINFYKNKKNNLKKKKNYINLFFNFFKKILKNKRI